MNDANPNVPPELKMEKSPSPKLLPSAKLVSTPKRLSKRLVTTPPRKRRQPSNTPRKQSNVFTPIVEPQKDETQQSSQDAQQPQNTKQPQQTQDSQAAPQTQPEEASDPIPFNGRHPKRVKDARALKPDSTVAGSQPQMASPVQEVPVPSPSPISVLAEEETSIKNPISSESTKLTVPRSTTTRTRKRKARRATPPEVVPSDPAKVFVCEVLGCDKRFRRSEHLKRHARSLHTLEKPYVCKLPGCDKKFSRSDNLNQHLRVHERHGVIGDGSMSFVSEHTSDKEDLSEQEDDDDEKEEHDQEEEEQVEEEQEVVPQPPSPVKPLPKRRRGGPRSVGAVAPKRRNRRGAPAEQNDTNFGVENGEDMQL